MMFVTKKIVMFLLICAGVMSFAFAGVNESLQYEVEDSWIISKVPASFPVGFCLLSTKRTQYVAYYDIQRRMTIASRALDSDKWQYQVLPSKIDWDSHNYITMAVDENEHLHVSGNMHNVPLIYFRMEKSGDITTLKRFSMTGKNEERCTYPKFMRDGNNRLLFHYREGGSGNGKEFYNVYDLKTKTWKRLLDKPLTDGEGKMNAYTIGPRPGPNGWFHIVWVWRDTSDCSTNHHLSHARSRDMIHWESAIGEKVELPLRLGEKKLWVDPIPSGGGIINGCQKLTFDEDHRPIITYHKADADGNMQIYAARPEGGAWKIHRLTDWKKPVKFDGRGSMGFVGIKISGLSLAEPSIFTMTYKHRDYGTGRLVIDEQTLRPLNKTIKAVREYPKELNHVQSDFAGMEIRRAHDIGDDNNDAARYILQWETLGANRDRPRSPPLPEPSKLLLYKLKAKVEAETTNKVLK